MNSCAKLGLPISTCMGPCEKQDYHVTSYNIKSTTNAINVNPKAYTRPSTLHATPCVPASKAVDKPVAGAGGPGAHPFCAAAKPPGSGGKGV